MRAGFHKEELSLKESFRCCRNPSLMRAGFHVFSCLMLENLWFMWSQSLVNEGRFPPKVMTSNGITDREKSRNPSLMRAGFHIETEESWEHVLAPNRRNPSLMRAGFHKILDMVSSLQPFYLSQSLVNEGRFPPGSKIH